MEFQRGETMLNLAELERYTGRSNDDLSCIQSSSEELKESCSSTD